MYSTVFLKSNKTVLSLRQIIRNAPGGALGDETKTAARETRPSYEAYTNKRVYSVISLYHSYLCEPKILFYQECKKKKHHSFFCLGKSGICGETLGFFPTFIKDDNKVSRKIINIEKSFPFLPSFFVKHNLGRPTEIN